MFSQILVAIDGSDTGKKALINAIELKKLHNSQLTVMHVVETAIRRPYTTYVEKSVVTGELAPPLATLPDSSFKKTLLRATALL
ncbi:MAG: universal stress protein, partial [Nitrososphaeria archaeon]